MTSHAKGAVVVQAAAAPALDHGNDVVGIPERTNFLRNTPGAQNQKHGVTGDGGSFVILQIRESEIPPIDFADSLEHPSRGARVATTQRAHAAIALEDELRRLDQTAAEGRVGETLTRAPGRLIEVIHDVGVNRGTAGAAFVTTTGTNAAPVVKPLEMFLWPDDHDLLILRGRVVGGPFIFGPENERGFDTFRRMKIPKTLDLNCPCGGSQSVALTFDTYESVLPGQIHRDFVYCDECQAPIAFELPEGLAKRTPDRYSSVLTVASGPMRLAS